MFLLSAYNAETKFFWKILELEEVTDGWTYGPT
jgi:hypothetical protein